MATTMATTASNTTTAARIRTVSHSMQPEQHLSSMGPQVSFFSLFYGPSNCFHSFFRLTLLLSSTKQQPCREDAGRGQEAHALGYRKVCFPMLSLTRHIYADHLSTPHPLGTTTVRPHQHQHQQSTTQHPPPRLRAAARRVDCGCGYTTTTGARGGNVGHPLL
jgi:hypothetical protein